MTNEDIIRKFDGKQMRSVGRAQYERHVRKLCEAEKEALCVSETFSLRESKRRIA